MCVYEPPLASDYVVVQGAAIIDDLVPTSELWGTARLVVERYVNADDVDTYIALEDRTTNPFDHNCGENLYSTWISICSV